MAKNEFKLNELDYRPLVELYLQDLINDKNNKRGKFSKLMNYIENYKQFFHHQVDNGKILLFKNYLKLSMNVLDVHLQIRLFGGPLTVQNCANHVIILEA